MALLIDGYNLLNVTGIFAQAGPGTELHRTRVALLNFLAASINQRERKATTIVFDAAGAPPGLRGRYSLSRAIIASNKRPGTSAQAFWTAKNGIPSGSPFAESVGHWLTTRPQNRRAI